MVLAAVLAMVLPLMVASPAHAAVVATTVSLSVGPSVAAPSETVVLSGVVTPAVAGRTVLVQRQSGTTWTTVLSPKTTSTGSFSAAVTAGAAGSKTSWRAVTLATTTAARGDSPTRTLTVVTQTVSLAAPASAETGLTFTLSGVGYPARAGRTVVVQRLSGAYWAEVGRTTESSTGQFSVSTSVSAVGTSTYRAVPSAWHGVAAKASPSREVAVHAPYLLLAPSTAIAAETVTATGKLPGVYSRPVWVQRQSGTDWVSMVKTTTNSTGSYAASFRAPVLGSYAVRALAPKTTVDGTVKPEYVSTAKALKVVAQTASLSMPATLVETRTGTATVTFTPVRTGRGVALQVSKNGVWTTVATGAQSSTGTASLKLTADVPGTYSYRALSAVSSGAAATASATSTLTVTPAGSISGTVTDAAGTRHGLANASASVRSSSTGLVVRTATTSADGGWSVAGLAAGTYTVCFTGSAATGGSSDALGYVYQCYDNQPTSRTSTPVTVTLGAATTGISAALTAGGAITGTVTDAGGNHHGLADVAVSVSSYSLSDVVKVKTAADGSYTLPGLASGADYTVCFTGSAATGGTSDASGYIAQCWKNQTATGTPTRVTVAGGVTTPGISGALAVGGAVSGTVTDAGGTHHGLANVSVRVDSPSANTYSYTTTADDGTWSVGGLPVGADNKACFSADGATGGSSDATGYLDQCYDNQPTRDVSTPIAVTAGETVAGIDAALAAGGGISGTVTDAAGTHEGLAGVSVSAYTLSGPGHAYATTAGDGSYTLSGLPAAAAYRVCFDVSHATGGSADAGGYVDQCYKNQPTQSTANPVVVTAGATATGTDAALAGAGSVSGTVTDAAGTQHGLSSVGVMVTSRSTSAYQSAETAADGSYTVTGLAAGTDYEVCFYASGATGGSSDAVGYVNECYDNQPAAGTLTPVTVTAGATRTGINGSLGGAGAVSGTVTDAGGTHHGLAEVLVRVTSVSAGTSGSARTKGDGSYAVTGLAPATDYKVCLTTSGATGGSADAAGYVNECYENQPTSDTATAVAVTAGTTRTGTDAALVGSPA
jgi:hypothetical protein